MEIDINVEGLAELERQLLKLDAMVAEDILTKALMSALLPVFKQAKADAPVGEKGNLKKSIKRVRHRAKKSRRLNVKGTISGGRNAGGASLVADFKKAPHAHLIEFGTDDRYTIGKGQTRRIKYSNGRATNKKGKGKYRNAYRGKGPAVKFMTRAWGQQGGEKIVQRFKKTLKTRLKRITK